MIRQQFDIENYWKVVVFYSLDYDLFPMIASELRAIDVSQRNIDELYDTLKSGRAKAVTYSNIDRHISIVLFNKHDCKEDYINSIVHEAEHVKQAMLKAYDVEDKGEPPAYTIGYLVSMMYRVFGRLICDYSCP